MSTHAAAFGTYFEVLTELLEKPDNNELQLLGMEITNAFTSLFLSLLEQDVPIFCHVVKINSP